MITVVLDEAMAAALYDEVVMGALGTEGVADRYVRLQRRTCQSVKQQLEDQGVTGVLAHQWEGSNG